jgi:hypothetical protein
MDEIGFKYWLFANGYDNSILSYVYFKDDLEIIIAGEKAIFTIGRWWDRKYVINISDILLPLDKQFIKNNYEVLKKI